MEFKEYSRNCASPYKSVEHDTLPVGNINKNTNGDVSLTTPISLVDESDILNRRVRQLAEQYCR